MDRIATSPFEEPEAGGKDEIEQRNSHRSGPRGRPGVAGGRAGEGASGRRWTRGSRSPSRPPSRRSTRQARELTLKGPKGNYVVMECPESVKRFNEIKVGDQITVKYMEALVLEVHKADSSAKLGTEGAMGVERHEDREAVCHRLPADHGDGRRRIHRRGRAFDHGQDRRREHAFLPRQGQEEARGRDSPATSS